MMRFPAARAQAARAPVAASLAVTACGSSEPQTMLNTEKVEWAIERSSISTQFTVAEMDWTGPVHYEAR
jgi:hypothetical protein